MQISLQRFAAGYGRILANEFLQDRKARTPGKKGRLTANDIIQDSRLTRVRELRDEVARLKAELAAAQASCAEWEHHFTLALAAAMDADKLPSGGTMLVLDGWNIVFNSKFNVEDDAHLGKQNLIDAVRKYAAAHATDFIWLVFDGSEANATVEGNLRINYTGGDGEQRTDRLVTDYVRLMRLTGRKAPVTVVTNDKKFGKTVSSLGVEVQAVKEFVDGI